MITLKRIRIAIHSIRVLLNCFLLMNTMYRYHIRFKRIQIVNTFIVGATISIFEMVRKNENSFLPNTRARGWIKYGGFLIKKYNKQQKTNIFYTDQVRVFRQLRTCARGTN